MLPYQVPPPQNAEIVLLHDSRAVHDTAAVSLAAYAGASWVVATVKPGPNSGKATTPGAYVRGDTGQVVTPPERVQAVLIKEGTWQVVAGASIPGSYRWTEPLEQKRVLTPEDRYSPFIHGGTVLLRPAPQIKRLDDLGPVTLLFSDWAQEVAPALAFVQNRPTVFGDKLGPWEERELTPLLSGHNRLLAVCALRSLQAAGRLPPEAERVYLDRSAGQLASIVMYLMLAGPGVTEALAGQALDAARSTRDPARRSPLHLGAYAASIFGDPAAQTRAHAVLEALTAR